jgi:2'-5' RNA ligase
MIQAMLRLFIGVLLPETIRTHVMAHAELLRTHPGIRWVAPSSIHITIKFIGSVDDKNISKIQSVLDSLALQTVPFSLALAGGGVFPTRRSPRIFWTGVRGDAGELQKLAVSLDEQLSPLGIATEKRSFTPHVTLAKNQPSRVPPRIVGGQFCTLFSPYTSPSFIVNEVHLIQSHLGASGSVYETRHTASIGLA